MNLEPKHRRGEEDDDLEEVPRRSIFSEWWFRAVVGVVALVTVAVIAVPYLLDWWNPPPPPTPLFKAQIPPPPPPLPSAQAQKVEPQKTPPAQPTVTPEPAPPQIAAKPPQTEAKVAAKPETKASQPIREPPKSGAPRRRDYWIQVGAFKAQAHAATLTALLAAQNYPARRFSLARPVVGSHEVFVVGASPNEVRGKLSSKEYQVEAIGADAVIRPALPLREAVNLSKQLTGQGLTVKIRRASSAETFHVVRVGGYPDRQHAQAVQKELAAKGLSGFIVKGEGR